MAIDIVSEHVYKLPWQQYLDCKHIEPSVKVADLSGPQYKLGTVDVNFPGAIRVEIVYEAHEDGKRRIHSVKHRQGRKNCNFSENSPEIKNSPSWS
jgi:hypothetical protein